MTTHTPDLKAAQIKGGVGRFTGGDPAVFLKYDVCVRFNDRA